MVQQIADPLGQRGLKRQPGGGDTSPGTSPGMPLNGASPDGRLSSSSRVYGRAGEWKNASIGAVSSAWPAYITVTRSQISQAAPRSCVVSRTDTPRSAA